MYSGSKKRNRQIIAKLMCPDRQTDRHTDGQTDRKTDRQTDRDPDSMPSSYKKLETKLGIPFF